jgi:hypothetical protein
LLVFCGDDGDGGGTGVGEREGETADAEACGDLGGAAVEMELGSLAGATADFELAPVDAAADAGAEGLGSGLLGSEAGGEALCIVLLRHAVGDLAGGVDAGEEGFTEALVAALDALYFDEVGAEAEYQRVAPWWR